MAPEQGKLGQPYDLTGKRVWVAGHRGMVGSAVMRRLATEDCEPVSVPRDSLDLRRQAEVEAWMADVRPQAIIVAAATVGGIQANATRQAEFLYDNLAIATNIVHAARGLGVEKLLFLGSACIYPREAAQPMAEEALLSGPLEPTNEWYAVAKIAGMKLCEAYRVQYGCDFISAQPNNLYGPGDNFDLETSHVIPALIAKTHRAKADGAAAVEVWGTGKPLREFLFVDDLADALVFLLKTYSGAGPINIGTGEEITVGALAEAVAGVVGFQGGFDFNTEKPDGAPRKLLDAGRLKRLGWTGKTGLAEGLEATYAWYKANLA
ncbi:MAG: GDP-L-fucose synthase [Rhodospirillales bacterium]|nr:GDP-L-fucose synthase [Rhodospirillales bacterium]